MADTELDFFNFEPDPDNPGWYRWDLSKLECYNSFLGPMIVREGKPGIARVQMFPKRHHRNLADVVHGGTMMGFIDCALFAAMRVLDLGPPGYAVTVDLQTQFTGAARLDEPLEAQVEVTRETGSFLFLRGLVVQGAEYAPENMASFSAIVKKAKPIK